jgi:hypothetical protein
MQHTRAIAADVLPEEEDAIRLIEVIKRNGSD